MKNKYKELWDKLFDYLNDYALAMSPADLEEGCEKCKRGLIYDELQEILKLMLDMEDKINEKGK